MIYGFEYIKNSQMKGKSLFIFRGIQNGPGRVLEGKWWVRIKPIRSDTQSQIYHEMEAEKVVLRRIGVLHPHGIVQRCRIYWNALSSLWRTPGRQAVVEDIFCPK